MGISRRTPLRLAGLAVLGRGARGPHDVEVVAEEMTGGDRDVVRLPEGMRRHVGPA